MKSSIKGWAGIGLGTAFLASGLAACGSGYQSGGHSGAQSPQDNTPPAAQERVHAEDMKKGEAENRKGESGEAGSDITILPRPLRLAFMTGHVKAGLALYRAGAPEMAAPHLLHPVSETHSAERAGLDELGFDASIFETVFQALNAGRPASEIEPQLAAAEQHLEHLSIKAGGDHIDIIRFMMETIVEEYAIAITDGQVSDAGEYQDAYGFALVARDHAANIEPELPGLLNALDALIALWPDGPIPSVAPAPVGKVMAQTSRVLLTLPAR